MQDVTVKGDHSRRRHGYVDISRGPEQLWTKMVLPGGLACAIACRRAGVDATVLEKNDQLTELRH